MCDVPFWRRLFENWCGCIHLIYVAFVYNACSITTTFASKYNSFLMSSDCFKVSNTVDTSVTYALIDHSTQNVLIVYNYKCSFPTNYLWRTFRFMNIVLGCEWLRTNKRSCYIYMYFMIWVLNSNCLSMCKMKVIPWLGVILWAGKPRCRWRRSRDNGYRVRKLQLLKDDVWVMLMAKSQFD